MAEKWTADIIGQMHLIGITQKKLAVHLGYAPEYVSAILNGKRSPKNAEQIFRKAVDAIKSEMSENGIS